MTRRTTTLLAALAILVAVAAAYSNSLSGPFIFDDTSAIQKNATIRSLRSVKVLIPPANVTLSRRPLANPPSRSITPSANSPCARTTPRTCSSICWPR